MPLNVDNMLYYFLGENCVLRWGKIELLHNLFKLRHIIYCWLVVTLRQQTFPIFKIPYFKAKKGTLITSRKSSIDKCFDKFRFRRSHWELSSSFRLEVFDHFGQIFRWNRLGLTENVLFKLYEVIQAQYNIIKYWPC